MTDFNVKGEKYVMYICKADGSKEEVHYTGDGENGKTVYTIPEKERDDPKKHIEIIMTKKDDTNNST